MHEARSAAIAARPAAATPGPWVWWSENGGGAGVIGPDLMGWGGPGRVDTTGQVTVALAGERVAGFLGGGPEEAIIDLVGDPTPMRAADATFIAYARQDVADLVAEVRRLRAPAGREQEGR